MSSGDTAMAELAENPAETGVLRQAFAADGVEAFLALGAQLVGLDGPDDRPVDHEVGRADLPFDARVLGQHPARVGIDYVMASRMFSFEANVGSYSLTVSDVKAKMTNAEIGLRWQRTGDHHQAGRVLVEAVDDARTPHAADAGERRAAMMDERVDQRARPVAGAGMHHETRRLVDDDQMFVLEHDGERNILALRLRGGRRAMISRQSRL